MKYAAWNLKSGPKLGSRFKISLSVDGASMIIHIFQRELRYNHSLDQRLAKRWRLSKGRRLAKG